MTRLETIMTGDKPGPGEAANRARTRRLFVTFAVLAAIGGVVGFTTAMVEDRDASLLSGGSVPGWFAILAALALVVAVTAGSVVYHRSMDELQRLDNYWATAMGANLLLLGYPVWLILWKGGLAPLPDAFTLYVAVFATTMLAYLLRKLR